MREPEFGNLARVLERRRPDRPTAFELLLNGPLCTRLAGWTPAASPERGEVMRLVVGAFAAAGFDHACFDGAAFSFPAAGHAGQRTWSLNDGVPIVDRASLAAYQWPDPAACDYRGLEAIRGDMPDGMRLMIYGPGGVLENAIRLLGYDRLCFLLIDDRRLAAEVFAGIGERLLAYYARCLRAQTVGGVVVNDDWGFKTHLLLPPGDLRELVFPWHRRIVAAAHAAGKPAVLHSCGDLSAVMEEVIAMGYDGKHSFEDAILPVEGAWRLWGSRIAILGGIDVDFLCRAPIPAIARRARDLVKATDRLGGYALGSGNSIPEYLTDERFFAMMGAID